MMKYSLGFCLQHCLVSFAMLLLSACSVFSPVKVQPENNYMLNALPNNVVAKHSHGSTIMLSAPDTSQAYNTTNMVYTLHPYEISYYARTYWAETPAQMLQPLLIQTLQNTHFFHAVVSPSFAGAYDYLLTTQILRLQQDFTRTPAVTRLVIRAQLIMSSSNLVLGTKLITVAEPIRAKPPYGGVLAANRATETALKQIAEFCLSAIDKHKVGEG